MQTHGELRIEPAAEILDRARRWLDPVRAALGHEFLSAYLTGSVLTQGFDPRHSHINLLVVARALDIEALTRLVPSMPAPGKPPRIEPLLLARRQIEHSLDVFPIEWLEIKERHLWLEGEDFLAGLEVSHEYLRLQCEHELRGKHIRMRHAYLTAHDKAPELLGLLRSSASSFATLFRTLLRLRGETPPADNPAVIERLAQLYGLEAQGLLGAHILRYSSSRPPREEVITTFRRFLTEIDRLVLAIDEMRVS
jgi:hypothetical protein